MIRLGDINYLRLIERSGARLLLDAEEEGEIWVEETVGNEETAAVGERVPVFVYAGAREEIVGSTRLPFAQVGDFAFLEVIAESEFGFFLDWGAPKDLLLPFREQIRNLRVGDGVVVYIYLDNTGRVCALMRTDKYVKKGPGNYRENQAVDLLISGRTDLGFKAIVNNRHLGILYSNEVFRPLPEGERVEGYIRKMREDGKLDLSLYQTSHKDAESISEKILSLLEERGGALQIGDKTSAEVIYDLLGISKKKFKIALGNLYKRNSISIEDERITLR